MSVETDDRTEAALELMREAAEDADDVDLDDLRPAERRAYVLLHGTDAAAAKFVEGEDVYRVTLDFPLDAEADT